ncbi:MAG: cytochrome c peroxidase [Ancalomicrobiaceae bacterium]|nr:cytochrome c peroxidase [Ancalomicrobiaceae bacterium]
MIRDPLVPTLVLALVAVADAGAAELVMPADNPLSAIKIELGRRLFYDADLSVNGTMSCATCHEQKHGFADGNTMHPGALGHPGKRNVPGLANVAYLKNLTWANNHLAGLEQQALNPLIGTAPIEMGVSGHLAEVVARFSANPCYVKLFAASFPERRGEISLTTATMAIAAFERTLISIDSPYDRAMRAGQPLPPDAEAGRTVFQTAKCDSCHTPPNFTDDAFHAVQPDGRPDKDGGLADETGRPEDRGIFRTPGLRNVAVTAPYWHNGTAKTLDEALRMHDPKSGVPRLGDGDVAALQAFFGTLTDRTFMTDPRFSLPPEACPLP